MRVPQPLHWFSGDETSLIPYESGQLVFFRSKTRITSSYMSDGRPLSVESERGFVKELDLKGFSENIFLTLIVHFGHFLEDHPRTCKWLITMVSFRPLSRVVGPLPNGLFMAYKRGVILTTC